MQRAECPMPRKKRAVRYAGRCPAPRQGDTPWTPGPLSLLPQVPERSSTSRVRSGPFRRLTEIRESGQTAKPACGRVLPSRWSAPSRSEGLE